METNHPVLQRITDLTSGGLHALHLAQTSSTNDDLKKMAGANELDKPTVLVTDHQTAGRGTRGREWFQAPGKDLAFSLAIPFVGSDLHDPRISLAVGAMLARELEAALWPVQPGLSVSLKWPNDVLLGQPPKKCGGILIETSGGWMLIGVGVNLNSMSADYPDSIANRITTVHDQLGKAADREQICAKLIAGLARAIGITGDQTRRSVNITDWVKEWRARDVTGGKQYLLSRNDKAIQVVANGVDFESGGLQCTGKDGESYTVMSYTELEEIQ